jgi:hypothetical protein
MTPELATVVGHKEVAGGLSEAERRLALGHMGFESWRRPVVGMHVS